MGNERSILLVSARGGGGGGGGDTFGATFANRYVGHYVITVRFGAGYLATISTPVSHRVSRRAKQTVR